MNNTFSFRRFGRYASTEFLASRRHFFTITWITAAIQIGIILISTLLFQNDLSVANRTVYYLMLVGTGIATLLFISHAFRAYHNAMSAPRMMMLPVSGSEKFTYTFLYNVIFIPTVLFCIIALIATLFSSLTDSSFELFQSIHIKGTDANIDITSNPYWEILTDGLLLGSIYLLGAALLRRAQFILTSVSLVGIMMILGWVFILFLFPSIETLRTEQPDPTFIKTLIDLDFIVEIITICLIPLTIAMCWLRFRTLQIRK